MLTVGIDIGTSYSSISMLDNNGIATPIKVSNGACAFGDSYSMPSVVFVRDNGDIVIGQLAVSSKMKNPSNYKGEFKRELGQDKPYLLGSLQLMPEDLYKEIFVHFKKCAEEAGGEKIGKAYITYPANFSKKKCELLERAAKRAGLLDVELIDEPTAAAYCYCSKGKIKDGDKLLVYDFGGGTFDVALIEYTRNNFKPVTNSLGIERCGGIDIDRMIFEDIMNSISGEILEPIKKNEDNYKRFSTQVLETSIKIKHHLTSVEEYNDGINVGFEYVDYSLSRNKLNTMISQLVDETLQQVKNIIKNARLEPKDISTVLLVGGTSRIPYIKERLEKLTGKAVSKDEEPELAVCKGAALWKGIEKEKVPEIPKKEEPPKKAETPLNSGTINRNIDTGKSEPVKVNVDQNEYKKERYSGAVKESSKGGLTDDRFILPVYDKAYWFSEGMAAVCANGKWGYIDENGTLVIQAMYDEVGNFSEGLANVKVNSKYGFIAKTGRMVIQPVYDFADRFSEGLAPFGIYNIAGKNINCGYIDKTGQKVIQPIYEVACSFAEGMAKVRLNGKWGYIDKTGYLLVQPKYDKIHIFKEGLARVELGGKIGFIDKTGQMIINPVYDDGGYFSEGLANIEINGKYGYIDKTGRIIIKSIYDYADTFSEGLARAVQEGTSGFKYGFIDKTGRLVIPLIYDAAGHFSDGLAPVRVNGKWGFIDKTGYMAIKPVYDNTSGFGKGMAAVMYKGKWGFIGKKVNFDPTHVFFGLR